jgi:hypothetical protein
LALLTNEETAHTVLVWAAFYMISKALASGSGGYTSSSVSEYQYATEEISSCKGK